jgi:hypothetical protein
MLGTTQKGLTLAARLVLKGGMRSLPLSRVPSAVGAFLAEFSSRRLVAGLALLVAFGSAEVVRAGPIIAADIRVTSSGNTVTVSFDPTGATGAPDEFGVLYGGDFINLSALSTTQLGSNVFLGSLVSITANVVLTSYEKDLAGGNDPSNATTVDDLTVYIGRVSTNLTAFNTVTANPQVTFYDGLLQVGGTNGTDPALVVHPNPNAERFAWYDFASTTAVTMSSVVAPIQSYTTLNLTPSSLEEVWLANAYTGGNTFGRWSGSLTFTYAGSGGSGVPDASRTALLLAPGTLLLLGLAGRARRRG